MAERLLRRLAPQADGCWIFTGAIDPQTGYGRLWVNGRMANTHRVAYELIVGPVPEGLTIDHLCRVRACCNPDHLEAVTHRVNVLRGSSPTAVNARKTHCINGHEFTPESTGIDRHGGRYCKTCNRERNAENYLRRKARRNAQWAAKGFPAFPESALAEDASAAGGTAA